MTGFPPQMMNATAVIASGHLFVWGTNLHGELGLGNVVNRSSPVQLGSDVWLDVSMGGFNTAGIREDGTAWAWGTNGEGQLAQNNTISRSSPVQIGARTDWEKCFVCDGGSKLFLITSGGDLWFCGSEAPFHVSPNVNVSSPVQIPGTWTDVAGGNNSIVMRKSDGTLWTWGASDNMGLCTATVTSQGPSTIGAGDTITGLTSGGTCLVWAIASSGGNPASNTYSATYRVTNVAGGFTLNELASPTGKLIARGIFSPAWTSSPIQTGNGTNNWVGLIHTHERNTGSYASGLLDVWGDNRGSLGLNTISPSPAIQSFPALLSGTWDEVAFGGFPENSAGIKSDGSLWAWGNGLNGAVGQNTVATTSSPVQVGGLTTWSTVAHGLDYWMAKKTDGTVFVCGTGQDGRLGTGNVVSRSSPVQLGSFHVDTIVVCGTSTGALIVPT